MNFYIKDINIEQFEIEVVTPMFLGGADKNDAELRTQSIKGMLRFWWRARYGVDDLEKMKKREAEIFGSTKNKASFNIQVDGNVEVIKQNLPGGRSFVVRTSRNSNGFSLNIIDYLAYGSLRDHREGYIKKYIKENSRFKIKFTFFNKEYQDEILNSFFLLINFGGLGAKSRNGFGSLNLIDNNKNVSVPNNLEIKKFTAFSKESKLFNNFPERNSWVDAMSDIGEVYRKSRLNINIENRHQYQKRAMIGRPIVQAREDYIRNGRLAKPLFMHINKINNKYKGQILLLPCKIESINNVEYKKLIDQLKLNIDSEIRRLPN